MQPRGRPGKPVKGRRSGPKARNASRAHLSIADLQEQLDQRTRERDEALEQQTAMSEVLRVISSSPGGLDPVFKTILENATRLCGANFGTLALYEGDAFRIVALHDAPIAFRDERQPQPLIRPKRGHHLLRLLETKKPVHIADISANPALAPTLAKFASARTLLSIPMLKENDLVGAMAIYRQEVRPFTNKQIELVQNFAAQAVIAIENTRLLNELRQRTDDLSESLEQQTATSEVLKVISSSPSELQPVFDILLENATRLCAAKFGILYLSEGDAFRTIARYNLPPAFSEVRRQNSLLRPTPVSVLGRLVASRMMVHIPDAVAEQAYVDRDPLFVTAVEVGGFRAAIAVPMFKDETLVGAIVIFRQEVGPFSDKQIELVKSFASQAVIAIENARLLNELRQRTDDLTVALEQQTATAEVLSVMSRSKFDLMPILQSVVNTAAKLCRADQAVIFRLEDGLYHFAAGFSLVPEYLEIERANPIAPGPGTAIGRAAISRTVVRIEDAMGDPDYAMKDEATIAHLHSIIGVPLLRDGEPIGVIALARCRVEPFSDREVDLITTFADQAAIAIENVRLFESVEARTRELAASLEDLRTAQDRLVQTEKLASLGQLTAGIAHEIKNPLNFVNNFSGVSAELIDELQDVLSGLSIDHKARNEIKELADTLRCNLEKVVQHGKRADAIVKNMLLHSRQDSQEHRPVDINAIVEESLNLAYHGARAEKQGFNITLERSLDPTAGEVDVFPQEVTRVLLNLISNGFYAATKRKAETDGGDYEPTLAAATRSLGDSVEIRIRDNGTGIPPEVKAKLFSPFFTTKPVGEGTGLGLSISHDIIVKQHGGSIEVETQPGEFTEFRIVLPRGAASIAKSGERA
jgi:two-component system NtrC family sensor kinase